MRLEISRSPSIGQFPPAAAPGQRGLVIIVVLSGDCLTPPASEMFIASASRSAEAEDLIEHPHEQQFLDRYASQRIEHRAAGA